MGIELGRENVCYVHLTLVPYISAAQEIKTKPTQHSVKELRGIGIQPDILLARSEVPVPDDKRRQIALFTNVPFESVLAARNEDCIYKIPRMFHEQGFDQLVCRRLNIQAPAADLSVWDDLVNTMAHPEHNVSVALVGKYIDLQDSYKSLSEALVHAGIHTKTNIRIAYIDSEDIEARGAEALLDGFDAILIPGGFGNRGIEEKSRQLNMHVSIAFPFSVSAWACSWQ